MQKYKIGYLVGRFQPFHRGHLHLIVESLSLVDKLIIGIGSVGIIDKDNFLSYGQRERIIRLVINKEGFTNNILKVVPLKDFHNDKLWLENCLRQSGKVDVIIGNNEWTNGIFEKAGYKILRMGFYKRYLYEGAKIRDLINRGLAWKNRVPNYIVKLLYGYIAKNEKV